MPFAVPHQAKPLQRFAVFVSVAALNFPGISIAQVDPPTESSAEEVSVLGAIAVKGNWLDQSNAEVVLDHAGARTVVDKQQIEESGATTVRDVLRQIPGVQVQDSAGTGGSDVSLNVGIRGLTSRLSPRSLIMLDGVPMSYAPYGQPQLSIAPMVLGNIDQVDVVRGAGSVRYGPQNVGGIINFVTRAIPEDFAATASVGTDLYSHSGHVKTTPSVFIGGTNDQGLGGAILYSGIHGQGFRKSNDDSHIDDIILKGSYRFSAEDQLFATLHHYEGKGRMPGGLTTAQYSEDPFQSDRDYDDFTGRRTDGSVKFVHNDGLNNFELLGYYVDTYRSSNVEQNGADKNAGKRRMTTAPRNYHYFGIEPRYSRAFDTGPVAQEISVGYRYLKERSSETAARTAYYGPGADPFAQDMVTYQTSKGGTTAQALYIDDRIDYGNWTITPGVRYEHIETYNEVTDFGEKPGRKRPSITSNEVLPTLSIMYRLRDDWTVFANAGRSFGPQQYSHLASTTEGLHPETANTYEIGTHFDGEALSGELTLFNIDFDKELQLTRDGVGIGQWTDLGATRHRGVESAIRYDLSDLSESLRGLSVSAT